MKELLASIWAVVKSVPVKLQAQGCANMRKHTLNVNCPKNKIVPSELNPLDKTGKKKKGRSFISDIVLGVVVDPTIWPLPAGTSE